MIRKYNFLMSSWWLRKTNSVFGNSCTFREGLHVFFYGRITQSSNYDRTVGDNSFVSTGPALDFSWEYTSHNDIQLDHFEQHRELSRRSMCELAVRRRERENILKHDFEISRKRIAHCIRSINRTKSQRRQTLNNLKFEGVEEFW